MTDTEDLAFPANCDQVGGLTKREYFAAKMFAAFATTDSNSLPTDASGKAITVMEDLAAVAVVWADALIAALNDSRKSKS